MSGILQKLPHTRNPCGTSMFGLKFIDSVEFIVVLLFNSIFFMMCWQVVGAGDYLGIIFYTNFEKYKKTCAKNFCYFGKLL